MTYGVKPSPAHTLTRKGFLARCQTATASARFFISGARVAISGRKHIVNGSAHPKEGVLAYAIEISQ